MTQTAYSPEQVAERRGRILVRPSLLDAPLRRIIVHWTAGTYYASQLDRKHYHLILEDREAIGGPANVAAAAYGTFRPSDNLNCLDGRYAAHTAGANTGSFGLAVACMGGAVKGNAGKYPLTPLLWERAAQAAAEIAFLAGIDVSPYTVLQHGEVEERLGAKQRGKWDITWLPFDPHLTAAEVCSQFRRKVLWYQGQIIQMGGRKLWEGLK